MSIQKGFMANNRSVQDYKGFLKENRELLQKKAIRIEDIPLDDDWILDDEWDEIYKQEKNNGCSEISSRQW